MYVWMYTDAHAFFKNQKNIHQNANSGITGDVYLFIFFSVVV